MGSFISRFCSNRKQKGIKSQLLGNPCDGHPATMNLDILDCERSQKKMRAKDSKAFWLSASHPNELLSTLGAPDLEETGDQLVRDFCAISNFQNLDAELRTNSEKMSMQLNQQNRMKNMLMDYFRSIIYK